MSIKVTLLPGWLIDILNAKGVSIKDYKLELNNANQGEFNKAQKLVDMILSELHLFVLVDKPTNDILKLSASEKLSLAEDVLGKKLDVKVGFVKDIFSEYVLPILSTDNTQNTSEIIICMGNVKGEKEFFRQLLLSLDRYVKREDLLRSDILTQYLLRKDVPVGLGKEGTASVKRDGEVSNEGLAISDPTSFFDGLIPYVNTDGWWWADHFSITEIPNTDGLVKRYKPIIIQHLRSFYKDELNEISKRERTNPDRIFNREFLKGNDIFINENFFPSVKYGKNVFSELPGVVNTSQNDNELNALIKVGNEVLNISWGYKKSPIRYNVINGK